MHQAVKRDRKETQGRKKNADESTMDGWNERQVEQRHTEQHREATSDCQELSGKEGGGGGCMR
jgi:hypothetical protein